MLKRAVQQGHSGPSILLWGGWDDANCARHSHLPAQWHVETCHYLGEYLYVPLPFLKGVAKGALYCAHRTSTFLSCAFCQQEGHLAAPFSYLFFQYPLRSVTCVDADIVKRQIGRPDVGSVAALSQSHRNRKFFPVKDFCDAAFSSESETHSFCYHWNPTEGDTQL